MTMYGANVDQLADLGRSLQRQRESIDTMINTVGNALAGTAWTGPARDQFEQQWSGTFRSALERLKQAFDAAGSDCVRLSDDLRVLLGRR